MKKELKKTLFVIYGLVNVILTNIILQFYYSFYHPSMRLVSQIIFLIYFWMNVFEIKSLKLKQFIKYFILNIFLWNFNWITIDFISSYGLSKISQQ